jgi:ketosteroid isomerase-like protein
MSSKNVERVLLGYDAINEGDLAGAVAGLPEDFELILPPVLPDVEPSYRGGDGFSRAIEAWRDSFDDFRLEIEEVIDAGDNIVVMAAVCGVGKDSGIAVRTPSFAQVWTFAGDVPVRMESLESRAAAVEALGLAG